MNLKEFETTNQNKVLIDVDSISSVRETTINGRWATIVVMNRGEGYTLDGNIEDFKRKLNM